MGNRQRSLRVNATLNALRSGLSIIFPLITYPYALRVLHADGIGRVNYASSIVNYFVLLASLGFANYATREGAKIRDDHARFNQFASEIFTLNFCSSVLALVLLVLTTFLVPELRGYIGLILLLGSQIVFNTFSLDWVNSAYEDFLYVTVRSVATQLISLGLMFLLVRSADDIYWYAMLTVVTQAVICIANYWYCRRYVQVHLVRGFDFRRHLQPIMVFFANSVATTLYVNSDTTMLGWIEGDYYVGIYVASVKIYTVIKTMLASLYGAVIPRIAYYMGQYDASRLRESYTKIFCNILIILLPASAGLACIAEEIMTFMGGTEYSDGVLTLRILSVSLVGAVMNGLLTHCINIPYGRERINAQATICSACINVILNLFMIPLFRQNGAAITTVLAEFTVLVYCLLHDRDVLRDLLDQRQALLHFEHAMLGVITVFLTTVLVRRMPLDYIPRMILIIGLSITIYGIELLIVGDEIAIGIWNRLRKISQK